MVQLEKLLFIDLDTRYKNYYGVTVATHLVYIQWTWNAGKITTYNNLRQDNSTAFLYGFNTEKDSWNAKGTYSGEANQSVKFESGIPTPWGHMQGGLHLLVELLLQLQAMVLLTLDNY